MRSRRCTSLTQFSRQPCTRHLRASKLLIFNFPAMHLPSLVLAPLIGLAFAVPRNMDDNIQQQPLRLPAPDCLGAVPTPVEETTACQTYYPDILQRLSENEPRTIFPNAIDSKYDFIVRRDLKPGSGNPVPSNRIVQFVGFKNITGTNSCRIYTTFPPTYSINWTPPNHSPQLVVNSVLTNRPQDVVAGRYKWSDRDALLRSGTAIDTVTSKTGETKVAGQPLCNTALGFLIQIPNERPFSASVQFTQEKSPTMAGFYMTANCS